MLKPALLLLLALASLSEAARQVTPRNSDEALDQLEGNNFNVYLLYFYQTSSLDKAGTTINNSIKDELNQLLSQAPYSRNEGLVFMAIDESQSKFDKLAHVVGITVTPSILMMVNGKGMWFSGANVPLLMERIREFLPDFLAAAAQRTVPPYAGYQ